MKKANNSKCNSRGPIYNQLQKMLRHSHEKTTCLASNRC